MLVGDPFDSGPQPGSWVVEISAEVPLASAQWSSQGSARYLVSFLIEHANGEFSLGHVASTALKPPD